MKYLIIAAIIAAGIYFSGCASSIKAQQPENFAQQFKGQYTYFSTGQYWGPAQTGGNALPPGVPGTDSKTLFDGGTFDSDGEGNIRQCGAGSWGTYTTPMNCVMWTVQFGTSDSGQNLNARFGIIKSNVGDVATIGCTETAKHCVMTAHGVGWAWTQILDREN